MHLANLGIEGVHQMGYAPMSKVLSIYTLMEGLTLAEQVSHRGQPKLSLHRRHRHRHQVRHERLEVLDLLLVAQNRVAPREVSPKTIAE